MQQKYSKKKKSLIIGGFVVAGALIGGSLGAGATHDDTQVTECHLYDSENFDDEAYKAPVLLDNLTERLDFQYGGVWVVEETRSVDDHLLSLNVEDITPGEDKQHDLWWIAEGLNSQGGAYGMYTNTNPDGSVDYKFSPGYIDVEKIIDYGVYNKLGECISSTTYTDPGYENPVNGVIEGAGIGAITSLLFVKGREGLSKEEDPKPTKDELKESGIDEDEVI